MTFNKLNRKDLSHFEYLYRDSDNYKAYGKLLLAGLASEEGLRTINASLEGGEFFVPEQVGIRPLQSELDKDEQGPSISDHAWHSYVRLEALGPEPPEYGIEIWGSVEELVAAFKQVKSWDIRKSQFLPESLDT